MVPLSLHAADANVCEGEEVQTTECVQLRGLGRFNASSASHKYKIKLFDINIYITVNIMHRSSVQCVI